MATTLNSEDAILRYRLLSVDNNTTSFQNPTLQSSTTKTSDGYIYNESVIVVFDLLLNCFLLHFLSLVGVVTNVLNFAVLSKHSLKETTTIWLMSLSFADLISSIFQPLRRINCIVERFDPAAAATYRAVSLVYLVGIPDIFISVSIFHTVAIAVERLVAVLFPLKVSRIFTVNLVKWVIFFMYAYTLVLFWPTWLFFDLAYVYDARNNVTRVSYAVSSFYATNFDVLRRYTTGAMTNLFSTSAFLTTTTCSVAVSLILTVGRRRALSHLTSSTKTASRQVKDLKVVKMLLTVCFVNAGISLSAIIINEFIFYSSLSIMTAGKVFYLLRSVTPVLDQLNATVNFIIYVTMSKKFSSTLVSLCSQVE